MNKPVKFFAVVSCFVLNATLAHAEVEKCDSPLHDKSHTSQQENLFKDADTNGDGAISKAEFKAYYAKQSAKRFKEMDTNKDGKLTPDEMQCEPKHEMTQGNGATHLDQRFNAADLNHDDGLDREEAKAMPVVAAYFDKIDTNGDGKVTRQEYLDAMPMLHQAKGFPVRKE